MLISWRNLEKEGYAYTGVVESAAWVVNPLYWEADASNDIGMILQLSQDGGWAAGGHGWMGL